MEGFVVINLAGWIGVAALLSAYALVSSKRLAGDSAAYQLLNAAGSVLLLINAWHYGALPSVAVNVAWIAVALYTLYARVHP